MNKMEFTKNENYDKKDISKTGREELLRKLEEQAAIQAAREEEHRKEVEKKELAKKEWQLRERKLYSEKLEMSCELFEACQTFLNDGEAVELLQSVSKTNLSTDHRGVEIMFNGWGHKPGCEVCWSYLYLKSPVGKPVLVYWAGFKWMPNFPERDITTPEQLAQLLSHEYISKVLKNVRKIGIYGMVRRDK